MAKCQCRFLLTLMGIALCAATSAQGSALQPAKKVFPYPEFQKVLKISSPAISPNGKQFAYLSNESGYPSVYIDTIPPSQPQKVIDISKPIFSVGWHPNGTSLVYQSDNDGDENYQIAFFDLSTRKSKIITKNAKRRYHLCGISDDGSLLSYSTNERNERFFDIYTMESTGTGEPKLLVQSDRTNTCGGGFSPDNEKYSFTVFHENNHQDAFVIDVKSGTLKEITLPSDSGKNLSAGWSQDGRFHIRLTDTSSDFMHLVKTDVSSGAVSKMFAHQWDVESVGWSKRGDVSHYVTNENGTSVLHVFKGEFQSPMSIKIPMGVLGFGNYSDDGTKFIYSLSNGTTPSSLYVYDLTSNQSTLVLDSNRSAISKDQFVNGVQVTIRSFDGLDVPAYLYLPHGASKDAKVPGILWVHGGPEQQEMNNFNSRKQYLINQGFALIVPNVRGSTGYGKSYMMKDNLDWGGGHVRDLIATARFLKAQEAVDPRRVAILGGSFGGYSVLSAITQFPNEFSAAIDIFGPSNLLTFLDSIPSHWRSFFYKEAGDPVQDLDLLRFRSPINHVANIKTPLLVIQGVNDPRVVKKESDQVVAKLKALKRPVEYLVFNDEGHGFSRAINEQTAFEKMATFLRTKLK
jgi:dipeptidyl aminopeptidase/acylaminoacyl peptidase